MFHTPLNGKDQQSQTLVVANFSLSRQDSTPSHLDGVHTVFGNVHSGYSTVDYIDAVQTVAQAQTPVNEIKIMNAYPLFTNDQDMDGIERARQLPYCF